MKQERRDQSAKHIKSGHPPFTNRALPPLPKDNKDGEDLNGSNHEGENGTSEAEERQKDYCASIEKVKDCGWYWGPISGEMAEAILHNEPDNSFIVRDSSDEHYFFSLTFKLEGFVRHVRIEHDQGEFINSLLTKYSSFCFFFLLSLFLSLSGYHHFYIAQKSV